MGSSDIIIPFEVLTVRDAVAEAVGSAARKLQLEQQFVRERNITDWLIEMMTSLRDGDVYEKARRKATLQNIHERERLAEEIQILEKNGICTLDRLSELGGVEEGNGGVFKYGSSDGFSGGVQNPIIFRLVKINGRIDNNYLPLLWVPILEMTPEYNVVIPSKLNTSKLKELTFRPLVAASTFGVKS